MAGLPVQLTSFIGRRAELADLRRLAGENRLVTLIGGPGIGKSRLALELASQLRTAAGFVAISGVTDPRVLPLEIATALEIPPDDLLAQLRERRCLLVLDGCEHLVDACADLADSLLRKAPGLSLIATSREPLSVPG